ncbi:MAG: hypothetical protein KC731_31385, partial [Myxococcales bacterium]|nr:hypothetical protein [Myxococcales bacterium]
MMAMWRHGLGIVALLTLASCTPGSSPASARPSQAAAPRYATPDDPSPPSEASASATRGATAKASFQPLLRLLDDDAEGGKLWWIRPDASGVPACQQLRVVPSSTGVVGRLEPVPESAGGYPIVTFGYALDDRGLRLDEPAVRLSRSGLGGSLPACKRVLDDASSLFTSAESCASAVAAGAPPLSLGDCTTRAAEVAAALDRDGPDRVAAVLAGNRT